MHDQELFSPKIVAENASIQLRSHDQVRQKARVQILRRYKWQPPQSDLLKLNVDAAIFPKWDKIGVAAVLRNATGGVLMALSKAEIPMEGSKGIELHAIFRGLQQCATMGVSNILAESDSLLSIEALTDDSMTSSLLGVVYYEIKKLAKCFVACMFSHVYREGNMVVHKLARNAWLKV
ncbi:hypothetical protein F2P56_015205 [Juglans regia]|uniref:RNase H type-1 domain-containing protein n=1 Tax=Juglans regia TaxID=51240 RepID=A0A833XEP0_JUGRE|nr:hypothetical protein F2P56_015205 [Juglans regia]